MEEYVSPLAATTHLLQHTLRSLCLHPNSTWVYAVFWRIFPRYHPPPKWEWEGQEASHDRSRGNTRNWILVWEDGFCNFAAASSSVYYCQGLQPELFFKMSHEIYNYGEGLIGKVAADQSHKWIHYEPTSNDHHHQETNFFSALHYSEESHPRTWEAQFQCGIKTIALIGVREGVVQLGGVHKVIEDLSYVFVLREKLRYMERFSSGMILPLLPHLSSTSSSSPSSSSCAYSTQGGNFASLQAELLYDQHMNHTSMNSLEGLMCKIPSMVMIQRDHSQSCLQMKEDSTEEEHKLRFMGFN